MSEQPVIVTGITPGLTIRTLTGCDGRKFSVADWLCSCGRHERATGRRDVTALAHRAQPRYCPHGAAA